MPRLNSTDSLALDMFIEELNIENILGCGQVKLCFKQQQRSGVYVVHGGANCQVRRAVGTAVKLICSSQYATIESLTNLGPLHQGSVRLIFLLPKHETSPSDDTQHGVLVSEEEQNDGQGQNDSDSDVPCTSQQARAREIRRQLHRGKQQAAASAQSKLFWRVDAQRDFRSSPEQIQYSVDGDLVRCCTVAVFHSRFRTNIDYMLKQPSIPPRNQFSGKWLQLITTELNDALNKNIDIVKLFQQFTHLFLTNHYNERAKLSRLTTCCLLGQTGLDIVLAADALNIFKDVRTTFEHITCMEYTVWFLIPHKGKHIDVADVNAQTLDFNRIRTCIKLKSCSTDMCSEYEWRNADQAVQDLLFIAFQLVMTYHLKRGIVYLQEELNTVKDYQTMKLVTAAYLQKNSNIKMNWTHKNYLQRIVEVCVSLKITAIIDYPGGLPVIPMRANLIKCYKDASTSEWHLKVIKREGSCSAAQLIEAIGAGLKQ